MKTIFKLLFGVLGLSTMLLSLGVVGVKAGVLDWQLNGSNIYYDGGNVGVGTSNPQYKLDVNDRIMRLSGAQPAFIMNDTNANGSAFAMYAGSPFQGFKIRDLGSGADRFTIDKDGNVGIGVYDPAYSLDVKGRIFQLTGEMPVILMNDSRSGQRTWGIYAGSPSQGFKIRDNGVGADRLVIDSNGKLGVRMTPSYDLDVSGRTIRVIGGRPELNLQDTWSGGHNWFLSAGTPNGSFKVRDATANKTKFLIESNGNVCLGSC
ncbi:hypothetical protein KC660_01220 [Candidatus Dojkabacteria bacterium]|uniref:Uncharacterized protein n=1 Tax=Candidatus Dojkabacteria bacterium TaxID=2099670 RepID=A0A955L344_9BACT|nr:hypothetical protein [Candidatus Dojkabacteria bacterium]